jgi:hypothetical protein
MMKAMSLFQKIPGLIALGFILLFFSCIKRNQCPEESHEYYNFKDALKDQVPYQQGDTLRLVSNLNDTVVLVSMGLRHNTEMTESGGSRECGSDNFYHLQTYFWSFTTTTTDFMDFEIAIKHDLARSKTDPYIFITTRSIVKVDHVNTQTIPIAQQYVDSVNLNGAYFKGYYFNERNVLFSAEHGVLQLKYRDKTWKKI